MKILLSLLLLTSPYFAHANPENDERCMSQSTREIFRLMRVHDTKVVRQNPRTLQIGPDMTAFDERTGVSEWASCGWNKYETERGALTQHYTVKLDRNCKVVARGETILNSTNCPKDF